MEIPCMLKISWTNLESIVCSSSIALFYFTGLFVFRCSSVHVYSMQFFLRVILLLKILTNNFDDECPFYNQYMYMYMYMYIYLLHQFICTSKSECDQTTEIKQVNNLNLCFRILFVHSNESLHLTDICRVTTVFVGFQ